MKTPLAAVCVFGFALPVIAAGKVLLGGPPIVWRDSVSMEQTAGGATR